MESPGEWLEKALIDLCKKVESGLSLDGDLISGLVSYCELAPPQDAKEYLDNIIGQEAGKSVIEEYLRRRGHSDFRSSSPDVPTSKLHAYVKPPSYEGSASGTKKALRTPKEATVSSNVENRVPAETSESRNMQRGNQGNLGRKNLGKLFHLLMLRKGQLCSSRGNHVHVKPVGTNW
ncbi:hypothetical protein L1049_028344 [Liquidambar formosana]|uniref:Uncharacterized protein n=1 Tax=Liquidambar formosana TaxID=63359 RepID=A0AAP0WTB3_LIQFO